MKVLIANLILYTNKTKELAKVNTIKDTMIYDLCLGFQKAGVDVTLAACADYKPVVDEQYPFEIKWLDSKLKNIFPLHALPYCPGIKKLVKQEHYDLIITSDVLSLGSLMLAVHSPENLIVWQELATHSHIFKGIASRVWYGVITRIFFRNTLIVPRSIEAKNFISQFCHNVKDTLVDHGVNLEKFTPCEVKQKQFAVSARLIASKQIEKTIDAFAAFLNKYDNEYKLYIMGDGEERLSLESQVKSLGISENVVFTGHLSHDRLIEILKISQAMLVYTRHDNNMLSIVESIAVGTPIITTSVPYNSSYIRANELGIVDDNWNEETLKQIVSSDKYIKNCLDYRQTLSTLNRAEIFMDIHKNR